MLIHAGPDVTDPRPGAAVIGLFLDAFGHPRTDSAPSWRIPPGSSFAQAASVPVAFLTAYIAVVEIAKLSTGQRSASTPARRSGHATLQSTTPRRAGVMPPPTPTNTLPCTAGSGPPPHRGVSHARSSSAPSAMPPGHGIDVLLEGLAGRPSTPHWTWWPRGRLVEIGQIRHPLGRRHRCIAPRSRLEP